MKGTLALELTEAAWIMFSHRNCARQIEGG